MANLLDEHLLPFASAVKTLPGSPHISTGYRFALRGIRGIVLETIKIGGKRFTSREAIRRFVANVTAATTPVVNMASPATQTLAADDSRAHQKLNKLGL